MFDSQRNPPMYLFLETTTECNLRCKMCHMWMSKERATSLSTNEKCDLIHQFHQLNPKGVVVLTGGETMLKIEEFFALTSLCRELGLTSAANTNATCIHQDNYRRILLHGPKYLVVSLDAHLERIHDYLRGTKGSWQHTVQVIRDLAELKRSEYPHLDTRVVTNTILCDLNIHYLTAYIDFAKRDLGIDGVMFQALSRTFWNQGKGDPFFNKKFFQDKEKAKAILSEAMELYREDDFLLTKENDLAWMKLYVDDPDFIGEQVCGSHERNIMIDQYGDAQLCFSMRGLLGGETLGNVRTLALQDLWTSSIAGHAREVMGNCRQNCGMLNCHRK